MENKLYDLNIYALRELGRRVGVNSPTSKKKDELIKDILSIQSGEKEPVQQKTKQGRPPKNDNKAQKNINNQKKPKKRKIRIYT